MIYLYFFIIYYLFYFIDLPFYNLNDSEFQLALSEFTNNFHYDLNLLNELSFNPFSLNNMVNQACNYLLVNYFNLKYEYKYNNRFSLIHINARCLSKNFEEISNYLSLLNHELPVIGISETWLTNLTSDQFNRPFAHDVIAPVTMHLEDKLAIYA